MINAYKTGKDLYATMAAQVYGNDYWDNMEHLQDGTANPEGKKRRSFMKSIVIGLLYGRGTASVAEQIGVTVDEAKDLIDKFFNGFPTVKDWMEKTKEGAHKLGYVEDIVGRRRRLPDIQLPKYQVILKSNNFVEKFNPLLHSKSSISGEENPILKHYEEALKKIKGRKEFNELKIQALRDCPEIELRDNSGFIAEAERQSINARVQGGASSLSKTAMIQVSKDPILQSYDFKILICVHDEIIGECKEEYAEAAGERLKQIMIESAATLCSVPMKVDTYRLKRWYLDDFTDYIHGKYEDAIKEGKDPEEVKNKLLKDYSIIQPNYLEEMMLGTYDCNKYADI